jgi:hypothetical protein
MNIQDLVYDVVVEEVKNKKLFNFLLNKWFGSNPTPEQIQQEQQQQQVQQFAQQSLADPRVAIELGKANSQNPQGLIDAAKQLTNQQ